MNSHSNTSTLGSPHLRLPHVVVMQAVHDASPRYHFWGEFYDETAKAALHPPAVRPHNLPLNSIAGSAFDQMMRLAGQNQAHWIALWLAVRDELFERGLIDLEGNTCP